MVLLDEAGGVVSVADLWMWSLPSEELLAVLVRSTVGEGPGEPS